MSTFLTSVKLPPALHLHLSKLNHSHIFFFFLQHLQYMPCDSANHLDLPSNMGMNTCTTSWNSVFAETVRELLAWFNSKLGWSRFLHIKTCICNFALTQQEIKEHVYQAYAPFLILLFICKLYVNCKRSYTVLIQMTIILQFCNSTLLVSFSFLACPYITFLCTPAVFLLPSFWFFEVPCMNTQHLV